MHNTSLLLISERDTRQLGTRIETSISSLFLFLSGEREAGRENPRATAHAPIVRSTIAHEKWRKSRESPKKTRVARVAIFMRDSPRRKRERERALPEAEAPKKPPRMCAFAFNDISLASATCMETASANQPEFLAVLSLPHSPSLRPYISDVCLCSPALSPCVSLNNPRLCVRAKQIAKYPVRVRASIQRLKPRRGQIGSITYYGFASGDVNEKRCRGRPIV